MSPPIDAAPDASESGESPPQAVEREPGDPPPREGEEDSSAEGDPGLGDDPESGDLVPPRLLRSVPPAYPASQLSGGLHPSVVLVVTLDDEGRVSLAEVEHGAGDDFDAAALTAVRGWSFSPALRGGEPVPSRVRVAVHFELPSFDLATLDGDPTPGTAERGDPGPEPEPESHATGPEPEPEAAETEPELGVEATVQADRRMEDRGASSFEIDEDLLLAAPRQEGADLLQSVPGVYAARAEGLAVGHRIFLRGFDAEHGQDIELRVGGLPINLPSHIHGQGYADLGFLIPEAVRRVRATEGVYDPRQGDFAVAGTINFDLGVSERRRGFRVASSYGMFDTFQQMLLWAPEGEREETFGAVQYRRTAGFGTRRAGDVISAIVQGSARTGNWRLRGLGLIYGARADLAGVLRVDDIRENRVGFYDAYEHQTAQSQNALTGRFMGGFFADYRGEGGAEGGLNVWVSGDAFRLQQNFTGFIQRSRTLAGVAGRGDLIEQRNQTISAGLGGRYQTERWRPFEWVNARLELGLDGRLDTLNQAQNLLAQRNETWDQRVDAGVFGAEVALYGDVQVELTRYVRINAGARGALLLYEIDSRLGNFVPDTRPMDRFVIGFRRSAAGATVGPRLSAEVKPLDWLSLRAAYGHGYRSPQARTLDDGERAPFSEVRSADLGAVVQLDRALRISVAGYWTELSDDVAFEPREGRLERIGATRRMGAVFYLQTRPIDWLVGGLSVTYVDAELLEPPPPSASDPQPTFLPGENLPYVPPVVARLDLGVEGTLLADAAGLELRGRLGIGYTFLSPRPLPFGGLADPVNLFDAGGGLAWGPVDLGVSVFNLFDSRYAAVEYLFTSSWDPEGVPSRVPARHISAGAPFTLMVTLGLSV